MATKLQKLEALVKKFDAERAEIERTVYFDDFKESFDQILSFVKEVQKTLENKSDEASNRLARQVEEATVKLESLMDNFRGQIQKDIKDFQEVTKSDSRTSLRMMQQIVDDLYIPEEYDDLEIRRALDELQASIPKEFDASELESRVKKNEDDIEELKKRPAGTVSGGVTNMRIIQAMKSAVKVEAPVGDIDGVNTTYTVSQPIFAILSFSLNGEFIAQLPNYTFSGNTITFSSALPAAYSGKDFEVTYF